MTSTAEFDSIRVETRGLGRWVFLNRPEAMNALSVELLDELDGVIEADRDDLASRVLVIGGDSRAFCTGADLAQITASLKDETPGTKDFLQKIQLVFDKLRHYPKPVVAAVEGYALAGGLELIMCCDLVFAAESARIGDAHSNFGILPGAGGASVLPRKIGLNAAKYILFTGDHYEARRWKELGLVNEVFPDGELQDGVEQVVQHLAKKSPLVLREMKRLANKAIDQDLRSALDSEALALRYHLRSRDLAEGLDAFNNKRTPEFRGY